MCYYKYLSNRCNCKFSNSPDLCFEKQCFLDEYFNDFQFETECGADCPLECISKGLVFTHNVGVFPSDMEYSYLKKAINEILSNKEKDSLKDADSYNSVIEINLFLKSLNYTDKTEIPIISNANFFKFIGIPIGLCVGTSLLSLFEIIELINHLVYSIIKGILRKMVKAEAIIVFFN